jgi:hypothetical protein
MAERKYPKDCFKPTIPPLSFKLSIDCLRIVGNDHKKGNPGILAPDAPLYNFI